MCILRAWRPYFHGSFFVVYSDHYLSRYLQIEPHVLCIQATWPETLRQFDFKTTPVFEKFSAVCKLTFGAAKKRHEFPRKNSELMKEAV